MHPLFSVVISVYNKENYIANTLKSVIEQTYSNFEIIIVNDGSTDNSSKILHDVKDDRISIINQTNSGASTARNNGIKKASGTFIALLDGDDLWHEDFLKTIARAIKNNPDEHVFATGIAHKIGDKIHSSKYNDLPQGETSILNYFQYSYKESLLSGSSTVFKRDILDTTGWFNQEIKSGQDTDLWIRFGLNYNIVFINKTLVYYVYSNNSLSNTTFRMEHKPKFMEYTDEEKNNSYLKKFLDKNRYAMALISKIHDQKENFEFYRGNIDLKNLDLSKRLLLSSPKWVLTLLLKIKSLRKEKLYYKPL